MSLFEQVMWERDIAMIQLAHHGIPFGGIATDVVKVVRCKNCKHGQNMKGSETYLCHSQRYDDYMFHNANHYCSYGEAKV